MDTGDGVGSLCGSSSMGTGDGVGSSCGNESSSGSMRVGLAGDGVCRCSKLESVCNLVDCRPCRIALRWPLWVAMSDGGYLFNCLTVKAGNVERYPAEIACARVVRVGEKRDA